MDETLRDHPVLDFGAGTGWITEFVARMGWPVTAFDIHGDLEECLKARIDSDGRIDRNLISFGHGDGHAMPFADASFGHILVFDTLHHMRDFEKVFAEFARILIPGGRAIFVEPGAKHSTSLQTIEFLRLKILDAEWIERDIVLEQIDDIASRCGFSEMTVIPSEHTISLHQLPLHAWRSFRAGHKTLRSAMADDLARINYDQRVVFYCNFDGQKRAQEYKTRFPAAINAQHSLRYPMGVTWHMKHFTRTMLPDWAVNLIRRMRPRA